MKIAIIGWGSLLWKPENLSVIGEWNSNGPVLPLEFSRISSDGRATLVIDEEHGEKCASYWILSSNTDLVSAKENLRTREGTTNANIGSFLKNEKLSGSCNIEQIIYKWLLSKQDIDAVIWTSLESNWIEKRQNEFSLEDLNRYLGENSDNQRMIDYFHKAPPQISTAGRETFNKWIKRHKNNAPGHSSD